MARGPYMNDDGDLWFPRGEWTWNAAQHEAAEWARWTVGGWARARYEGITRDCRVSDEREETHPVECDPVENNGRDDVMIEEFGLCDGCCRTVEAYHFLVVEP